MGSLKILVLVYIKAVHVSDILKSKSGYLASSVCPIECLHETPVRTLPDFCDPCGEYKFEGDLLLKYCTAWERFYFTSKEVTKHSSFTLKRVVHWDVTLPRDTQIGVDSVMNRLLPSELFSLRMAVRSCSYTTNSELMQIFCRAQPLKLIHGRSEVLRLAALEIEVFWGVQPVK